MFEAIRYPDEILRERIVTFVNSGGSVVPFDQIPGKVYGVHIPDIDDLVECLFHIASVNPLLFKGATKAEAERYLPPFMASLLRTPPLI